MFRRGEVLTARKLNNAFEELRRAVAPSPVAFGPGQRFAERVNYLWPGRVLDDKPAAAARPSVVGGYVCEVVGLGTQTDALVPLDRPVFGDEAAIYPAPLNQLVWLAVLPADGGEDFRVELVWAFEKVARVVCASPPPPPAP